MTFVLTMLFMGQVITAPMPSMVVCSKVAVVILEKYPTAIVTCGILTEV